MCISPNIFEVFLDVDPNHLSLGLPYASRSLGFYPPLPHWSTIMLPLGYIKGEELKSKKTIVHCCRSLLILESASFCPLEHFLFFPSFPFLVSFLLIDGGLRWWRPKWRNQFLQFLDVPIEVVTYVISDLLIEISFPIH